LRNSEMRCFFSFRLLVASRASHSCAKVRNGVDMLMFGHLTHITTNDPREARLYSCRWRL
jgi:hypothetical protein